MRPGQNLSLYRLIPVLENTVAGDPAVGGGVLGGAEAAGDFLFDLGHAAIALGAVVGERHVEVAGEAEHLGFVLDEGFVQVFIAPFPGRNPAGGLRRANRLS